MKRHCANPMFVALVFGFILIFSIASQGIGHSLPKRIVYGANVPGSLFYVMAAGMGKVITDHSPMKVEIFPQGGTVWYPMLQSGEVDFGINVPSDILAAYMGEELYEKPTGGKGFPLRTLMLGSPLAVGFMVPDKTDIKSFKDIRGKRVPVDYGAFYSSTLTVRALLANAGFTTNDVKALTVTTYAEGVRTLIEGRSDLAMGSVGSGITQELKTVRGARYLNVDTSPEGVDRMKQVHPGYYPIEVEPGPAGVAKPTIVLGKDITIVCMEEQSEDVAYYITKTLWENYKELAPFHPRLKSWTPDRFASTRAVVPYHLGSIKWYKEMGVWTKELEKHQKKLLMQK